MWRAALVGCGNIGGTHSEKVEEIDGASMVAFCDVIEDRAEEFADRFDGDYATTDPDRIFDDESIDVVYVCTQHDTHAEYSTRAAEAGKHIMVEKPLALTVEECRDIGQAVAENDVQLMPAFKMRYFELIRKAKELVPDPNVITMQMMDDRWPDDMWANDPVKGGGNVLSQGVHSTDIMRYLVDSDPVSVAAEGGNYYQSTGVVDNMTAVYEFENGVAGNLVQGDNKCPSHTSKFFLQLFDEGEAVTLSDRFCRLTYDRGDGDPEVYEGEETGFMEENRAFFEALENGDPVPIDHRDGLLATLMILRGMDSIESGETESIHLE